MSDDIKKKLSVVTLSALLFTLCDSAQAQQLKKVPRIGFLSAHSPSSVSARQESFRQALREFGYMEGKNIFIEWRYAEAKLDRLPALAAELASSNLDVIIAGASPETQAAMTATKTIPIVMATSGDPVGSGFIASLAHPGGNVTGSSQMSPELGGKRLELLKESLKKIAVVGVLHDGGLRQALQMKEMEAAAQGLAMQLQIVKAVGPNDLDNAFSTMNREHTNAFISLTSSMFLAHRGRIVELAAKNRLPAIYPAREFADSGGLMSYGPNISENYRRAATYVDKILKGAKPADLPVEQPTKFELVINLNAAKQIGLTIPQRVLLKADKVIK